MAPPRSECTLLWSAHPTTRQPPGPSCRRPAPLPGLSVPSLSWFRALPGAGTGCPSAPLGSARSLGHTGSGFVTSQLSKACPALFNRAHAPRPAGIPSPLSKCSERSCLLLTPCPLLQNSPRARIFACLGRLALGALGKHVLDVLMQRGGSRCSDQRSGSSEGPRRPGLGPQEPLPVSQP